MKTPKAKIPKAVFIANATERVQTWNQTQKIVEEGMKPQHTPTPWEAHEDWNKTVELFGGDPPDKCKNITNILSWEDAAYIVKCVNLHEALVEALKKWHHCSNKDCPSCDIIAQADSPHV